VPSGAPSGGSSACSGPPTPDRFGLARSLNPTDLMKKYTESELESLVERVDALGGYL
jgi:hypothetical protein